MTTHLTRPSTAASALRAPQTERVYRPEIEGLRAVAALLVAVFHIWVGRVSGGVDVFFTVSGFLITTTLLGHLDRFGRVRPLEFLGRLLRRLLPAALVVLAATLIATWVWVPAALRERAYGEIFASALYFENWQLAMSAVDYLDREDPQTPVQHFWAMSIQWQFYLIWALIFMLAVVAARISMNRASGLPAARPSTIAFSVVAAVTLGSFAHSVWFTAQNQPVAYFSTFTRVWEFGLGALLALVLTRITIAARTAWVAGWAALAAILLCGALLPVADAFPGYAALVPVSASALVLITGNQRETPGHAAWLLSRRPLVWLGGISYGIYLWHWPLLVIVRHHLGKSDVGLRWGLAIIAVSMLLAWATTALVERPLRAAFERTPKQRRLTTAALVAAAVTLAAVSVAAAQFDARAAAQQQITAESRHAQSGACFGVEAMFSVRAEADAAGSESAGAAAPHSHSADCEEIADPQLLSPAPSALLDDTGGAYQCYTAAGETEVVACSFGSRSPDALRIALVGNSHAAMLVPAIQDELEARGWHLDTFVGNGCVWGLPTTSEVCLERIAQVDEALFATAHASKPYDVLLATTGNPTAENPDADARAHVQQNWQRLADLGTEVIVITDNPRLSDEVTDCVRASSPAELVSGACSITETEGYASTDLFAEPAYEVGVTVLDTRDLFCRDGHCPAVIGNTIVYRDSHHITATYGRTLGPILADRIETALTAAL